MEMQCDNKKECVVKATNRNLGDPCKGIYKHLDIEFYCDATPPLSTSKFIITIGTFNYLVLGINLCEKLSVIFENSPLFSYFPTIPRNDTVLSC